MATHIPKFLALVMQSLEAISNVGIFVLCIKLTKCVIRFLWTLKLMLREFPIGFISLFKGLKEKFNLLLKVSRNLKVFIIMVCEFVPKILLIKNGRDHVSKYHTYLLNASRMRNRNMSFISVTFSNQDILIMSILHTVFHIHIRIWWNSSILIHFSVKV